MKTQYSHLGSLWATLVVRCLVALGIEQVYLAPGSRSTPLVQALSEEDAIEITTFFDERSLAFSALGYAKATGRPACLITTSGTAVANTLPAIIEAYQSQTPVLLLSADRPPELIGVGANQAIDQVSFLTDYVRAQKNITPADIEIPAEVVVTEVVSALHALTGPIPGPVHLNMMFREPLTESETTADFTDYLNAAPDPSDVAAQLCPEPSPSLQLEALSEELAGVQNGLIVAGLLSNESERTAVLNLATRLQWPILPDVVSGLRLVDHPCVVAHGLNHLAVLESPEFVLLVGSHFTRRSTNEWITNQTAPLIHLKPFDIPVNPWQKDDLLALAQDLTKTCTDLCSNLPKISHAGAYLKACVAKATPVELSSLSHEEEMVNALTAVLPEDCQIFWGNSLTIRHVDRAGSVVASQHHTLVNRGASGIDGLIATALGAAEATGKQTFLVLGDMSALHDLNTLKRLADTQSPLKVMIINNNGGRIFEKLAIQDSPLCSPYFVMPTEQSFEALSEAFSLSYQRVKSAEMLKAAVEDKSQLIEVVA